MYEYKVYKIFSVEYDEEKEMICTTSDDRSARIWSVNFKQTNNWTTAHICLTFSLYGHSARVFR